ncbi:MULTISPECIES: hypothetical protein [unclassified Pseudoalteromonas]|uniref:hypothetical protein n=1 Tax=unclassified Pseudoalteromonas TaxID=194690 RepID=UPI00209802C8|nr:hypothetical protein [Pseudoalteromonas sp. XMcav2-N]MCO7188274.1 hypothetical protein [Pseudoalteromonas sp. XMcav2-N]
MFRQTEITLGAIGLLLPDFFAPGLGINGLLRGTVEVVLLTGITGYQHNRHGINQLAGVGIFLFKTGLFAQRHIAVQGGPQAAPGMDGCRHIRHIFADV